MIGIRLPRKKEASLVTWSLGTPRQPSKVRLCFHPAGDIHVRLGDKVKAGQYLGQSLDSRRHRFRIHSPANGQIENFQIAAHPLGGETRILEILTDRKDESFPSWQESEKWAELDSAHLMDRIREAGVVTMDERMLAADGLLERCRGTETIAISATESEPYVTCHQALVMTHPMEILKGANVVRRLTGAAKIKFLFEEDQEQAAELIKSKIYFLKWDFCEVIMLPALYPQRHDAELRSGKDQDFSKQAVLNVTTVFALYEAAAKKKPMVERPVTVGGECVIEPRNVWLKIGTSLEDGFKTCKGLLRKPEKIMIGGPMRGFEQKDHLAPIVPAADAILALPKEVLKSGKESECIRCGWCNEVCPSGISPATIALSAGRSLWERVRELNINHCIECANCSYVCPSNIPVLDWIQYGKNQVQ